MFKQQGQNKLSLLSFLFCWQEAKDIYLPMDVLETTY